MPYYGRKRRRSTKKGMAYRKRRRFYRSKRKAVRRSKASKVVIRQPSGLPDRLFVKLKYSTAILFSDVVGGVAKTHLFRGNSPFDPDLTATGHQCYLFDQWQALYQQYRVHGSKARVRVWNNATGTTNSQIAVTLAPLNINTVLGGTPLEYWEIPYARRTVTSLYKGDRMIPWTYMSSAKITGVRKEQVRNDVDWASVVTGNPTRAWSWHLMAIPVDGASTWSMYLWFDVIYYTEFALRAYPGQS